MHLFEDKNNEMMRVGLVGGKVCEGGVVFRPLKKMPKRVTIYESDFLVLKGVPIVQQVITDTTKQNPRTLLCDDDDMFDCLIATSLCFALLYGEKQSFFSFLFY